MKLWKWSLHSIIFELNLQNLKNKMKADWHSEQNIKLA